jgi:hypothetical protein
MGGIGKDHQGCNDFFTLAIQVIRRELFMSLKLFVFIVK